MSTDEQMNPRGVQRNRPDNLDALASTVISVLRGRQVVSFDGLRQFVLDHMVRAVLNRGAFSPDGLLLELRGYRLTVDTVIDQYVPEVARILGTRWVEDKIGFADVTIGMLRLQALLGEASAMVRMPESPIASNLHALVVVPQGEQHFLGASVVASQMRRLGCDVDMSFDEDLGALASRLIHSPPDLVMISCARRETLESAANTVQTIRDAVSDGPVVAVGGALTLNKEDVITVTGADISTKVAGEAVAFCAKKAKPQRVR